MEEKKIQNPNAFPNKQVHKGKNFKHKYFEQGMTLRDYFAAKAMQGMLARGTNWIDFIKDDVKFAYKIADSMLNQRTKQ